MGGAMFVTAPPVPDRLSVSYPSEPVRRRPVKPCRRNKQRAMGVDSPLYGRVTTSMLSAYGEPIPFDRFIHPRVESEIAFLLARDSKRRQR